MDRSTPTFSSPPTRRFAAVGIPRTKGNLQVSKTHGRMYYRGDGKLKTWRKAIRDGIERGPSWAAHRTVSVTMTFLFERPASHTTKSGELSAAGRRMPGPTGRKIGDIDKLVRVVLDELTGPVLADDSQVVFLMARKRWTRPGEKPGVFGIVTEEQV